MGYWGFVLAVCVLYSVVLFILCYSLPFSQLFRQLHSYESLFAHVENVTRLRTKAATEYFQSLDSATSMALYRERQSHRNITFAIGIVSIRRSDESRKHESPGYLLQSASLMDRIMKTYTFFNNSVPFICNVDIVPDKHFDAVQVYKYMPYTERYGSNSLGVGPISHPSSGKDMRDITSHLSKYQKETYDYLFCLLSAAALGPKYIILIEDDSLAHKDFPSVLEHLLTFRLKSSHGSDHKSNFAYLKLYFPPKWQGFAFEVVKIIDLISWSIVGATVLCLAYVFHKVKLKHSSGLRVYRVFFLGFMAAMISCWLLGHQNVNEIRRLSKHFYRLQSSEGCCTQAMLYPAHVVNTLSMYLTSKGASTHTDLAIMDFAAVNSIPTLQVEPNLFHHAGLHTTLDLQQKHPEEFIFTL